MDDPHRNRPSESSHSPGTDRATLLEYLSMPAPWRRPPTPSTEPGSQSPPTMDDDHRNRPSASSPSPGTDRPTLLEYLSMPAPWRRPPTPSTEPGSPSPPTMDDPHRNRPSESSHSPSTDRPALSAYLSAPAPRLRPSTPSTEPSSPSPLFLPPPAYPVVPERDDSEESISPGPDSVEPENHALDNIDLDNDEPMASEPIDDDSDTYHEVIGIELVSIEEVDLLHGNANMEIVIAEDSYSTESDNGDDPVSNGALVSLADSYFPTSTHRGTLGPTQPVTSGWLPSGGRYAENETFFPVPVVTFLVDKPRSLKCRICMESPLSVRCARYRVTDRTPAIMPCGHVAGARCLASYFATGPRAWSCPFCRVELVHPLCGHRVRERVLNAESIRALPPTLPRGGTIRGLCAECRVPGAGLRGAYRAQEVARELAQARAEYEAGGAESAAAMIMDCVGELEAALADSFHEVRRLREDTFSSW